MYFMQYKKTTIFTRIFTTGMKPCLHAYLHYLSCKMCWLTFLSADASQLVFFWIFKKME